MELDDFKLIKRSSINGSQSLNDEQMEKLYVKIRENFTRMKKTAIRVAVFNMCLAIIYVAIWNKDDQIYNTGLTMICAGLIIGSLFSFSKSRGLNNSVYSLPLLSCLRQTEKKLEFMPFSDMVLIVPALALLGTGGGFIFVDRLSKYTPNTELMTLIYVIFFITLIIFSFTVSRID